MSLWDRPRDGYTRSTRRRANSLGNHGRHKFPYVDEQNTRNRCGFAALRVCWLFRPPQPGAYEGDTTPPTLTWGNPTPVANGAGWNNTPVDVPFTTSDDLSGVESSAPESPLHFTSEGANQTQQVTVTDRAGHSAEFTSPPVNIDFTTPATSSAVSGVGGNPEWYPGPVMVGLNASDNLSGVAGTFYRLGGGAEQTYTGAFSISSDGVHSIEFWSVDVAGNAESHQSRIVKIDSTAPVTQAAGSGTVGTNGWYRSAVQVSLSASDNVSGVNNSYYRIDGGAIQTYVSPFSISANGQHTVEYWSMDNAGNSEATRSVSIDIDPIAPVVTATASPSTAKKSPHPVTVTISGSVTAAISGAGSASYSVLDEYGVTQPSGAVTLQVNGNYSFSLSLPATKHGTDKDGHLYTITVHGFDQAGNSTTATATLRIN